MSVLLKTKHSVAYKKHSIRLQEASRQYRHSCLASRWSTQSDLVSATSQDLFAKSLSSSSKVYSLVAFSLVTLWLQDEAQFSRRCRTHSARLKRSTQSRLISLLQDEAFSSVFASFRISQNHKLCLIFIVCSLQFTLSCLVSSSIVLRDVKQSDIIVS